MDRPLDLPTKVLHVIWALLTIPGGLLFMFWNGFATTIVWPPPFEPIPFFNAQLVGTIALATGVAVVLALRQNRWAGSQPIIGMYIAVAISAEYVALSRIVSGPVPFQLWVYVVLGIVFLVLCGVILRGQAQADASARQAVAA
jgi:hypothetical protein